MKEVFYVQITESISRRKKSCRTATLCVCVCVCVIYNVLVLGV